MGQAQDCRFQIRGDYNLRQAFALAAMWMLMLSGTASAAYITGLSGQVRMSGDPSGTNYFTTSQVSPVGNGAELSGTVTFQGLEYAISADLQPFTSSILIIVGLTQTVTNGSSPILIFTFSDIQFNTNADVASITDNGGTPGVLDSLSVLGPRSAQVTTNQTFLANGGSYGRMVTLNAAAPPASTPEPATGGVTAVVLGAAALSAIRRRVRRTSAAG